MKLTNSEISAIVDKAYNTLYKAQELELKRIVHEYIPSVKYINSQHSLDQLKEILHQIKELQKKADKIKFKLKIDKCYPINDIILSEYDILKNIIKEEHPIKDIPNKDSIRNEVIIANINKKFNVNRFIKNIVEQWKINL